MAAAVLTAGCAPDTVYPRPAERVVDAAPPCAGVCGGSAPLALEQDGVCEGLRSVCRPEDCEWIEPDPMAMGIVGYEADETRCDGLDNDCDGRTDEAAACATVCGPDHCEPMLLASQAVLYDDDAVVLATQTCVDAAQRGWHIGPQVNAISLPWTHVSDCALPPPGQASPYAGRRAEWSVEIEAPGRYEVQAKVPAPGYLCTEDGIDPRQRYGLGITWRLVGPTPVEGAGVDPAPHAGSWAVVIPMTALERGTYTLVVFDRGDGGLPCDESAGALVADPAAAEWLPVDAVRLNREEPAGD